jgi:3-phenylpropionate/trans-cinnamate dioxygenase ferredoxin reductase component
MVSSHNPGLVVIGGGQASIQLIEVARQEGYSDPVTLISAEASLPYQRPPLSKQYLAGEHDEDWLLYRPGDFYRRHQVKVLLDSTVVGINRDARQVSLEDGTKVSYATLALATGARATQLTVPGHSLDKVYYIRTIDDVNRLRPRVPEVGSVTIIGAGFIGLEAAAVLARLGKKVTVLASQDRILAKLGCPQVSEFLHREHTRHGVELALNAKVSAIRQLEGGDVEVSCEDGRVFASQMVIVGIGAIPNVELFETSGLACDNGIVVDEYAVTSDPNIVAAGDCTSHPSGHGKRQLRLETVHNAVEQGRTAGFTVAGKRQPYVQTPWVWSDQYKLRIQSVGISEGYDHTVVRGSPAQGSFTVFYFHCDHLLAATSINQPHVFAATRRILNERLPLSHQEAADEGCNLRNLPMRRVQLDFEVPWPSRVDKHRTTEWGFE